MTMPGKGILAMDESNATCGSRLEGVGVENIEENRRRYRELLITTPDLGEHIGGAILFEETLYQSCSDGTSFVDALNAQGIYPGIKVDKVSRRDENTTGCSGSHDCDDPPASKKHVSHTLATLLFFASSEAFRILKQTSTVKKQLYKREKRTDRTERGKKKKKNCHFSSY